MRGMRELTLFSIVWQVYYYKSQPERLERSFAQHVKLHGSGFITRGNSGL